MKDMIWEHLIDRSDRNTVRYGLICPSCREEWVMTPRSTDEALSTEARKRQAAEEAERLVDLCPLCGRLVCKTCMVAAGELHMCRSCAGRMDWQMPLPAARKTAPAADHTGPAKVCASALFDRLCFSIMPRLNYWMDGKPGKRTLFIADESETVMISIEEGMRCLDLQNADTG